MLSTKRYLITLYVLNTIQIICKNVVVNMRSINC